MKYKNVEAFEKHLRESAPDHFSNVYLFLISNPFEREFYTQKLFTFIRHFRPQLLLERSRDFTDSLFQDERFFALDIEEKEDLSFIKKRGVKDFIVLRASEISPSGYRTLEKEAICLDLLEEKPWDRERRYSEETVKLARAQGKIMSVELAAYLVERVGLDLAFLKNEIDKLSLFIHPQKEITKESIEKIASESLQQNLWKIAESTVFDKRIGERPKLEDVSDWLSFIGQLRFYLYMGLEIAEQIEKKLPIQHKSLKKSQEKKIISFCKERGSSYFVRALNKVFELELKAKSAYVDPSVLWDLFVIHSFA